MTLKLKDKVVVITGAGSGIGRAMAELFSSEGAEVFVVDVIKERVNETVSVINSKGGKSIGMVLDLSIRKNVEQMIDQAYSKNERIDILCNNAGIMDGANPVVDTDDQLWERVLNINLNAPFWATRKALPYMIGKGGGTIVNTSSVAGFFGGRAGAAYTASKHALIGLTRSTAATYGQKGIKCNAMALGAIETAIGIGQKEPNKLGFEVMNKVMGAIPRIGKPIEIAKVALFLASDDSSYLNGSVIIADDGWTNY